MEKKEILIMTSFGPVPFDAVKEHLPKDVVSLVEANRENILKKIENVVPMDLDYYLTKIADRMGWKVEKLDGYLGTLASINFSAVFSIILKEIAIELDKKYDDHINESEKIFVISVLDGRIHEVAKAHIKNYRNFAAFRTIDDAKTACRITKRFLKDMFSNCGEK